MDVELFLLLTYKLPPVDIMDFVRWGASSSNFADFRHPQNH